jgi:hypothetical protein
VIWRLLAVSLTLWACGGSVIADACPFCGAVGQPLASRRDAAAAVAVGEAAGPTSLQPEGALMQPFRLRQRLAGRGLLPEEITATVTAPVQGTAAVFLSHTGPDGNREATAIEAD